MPLNFLAENSIYTQNLRAINRKRQLSTLTVSFLTIHTESSFKNIFLKLKKPPKTYLFYRQHSFENTSYLHKILYGDREAHNAQIANIRYRKFEPNIPRKGLARPQSQHSCVCERFIYIPTIGLSFLLQESTVCCPILGIYK